MATYHRRVIEVCSCIVYYELRELTRIITVYVVISFFIVTDYLIIDYPYSVITCTIATEFDSTVDCSIN